MAEAFEDQRVAPGRDRISALPDAVLLLSRRWRHLWRSVPIINASVEEFEAMAATPFECEVLFKKFVNRMLMLRNPVSLDEFRFRYRMGGGTDEQVVADSADTNLWICHALQCNAQAIVIGSQDYQVQLVPAVFTSTYFKRLHISNAHLVHGFFRQLQEGCPELEYLCVSTCAIDDAEISSNTLKALALDREVEFVHPHRPYFSAPRLISLCCLSPSGARPPSLNNMASLETASVSLEKYCFIDFDADDLSLFLKSLSGVRSLDFFYGHGKLMVEKNYQWCPVFSKLVNLTLHEWCLHEDFYALIVFLQNSPSLKK